MEFSRVWTLEHESGSYRIVEATADVLRGLDSGWDLVVIGRAD